MWLIAPISQLYVSKGDHPQECWVGLTQAGGGFNICVSVCITQFQRFCQAALGGGGGELGCRRNQGGTGLPSLLASHTPMHTPGSAESDRLSFVAQSVSPSSSMASSGSLSVIQNCAPSQICPPPPHLHLWKILEMCEHGWCEKLPEMMGTSGKPGGCHLFPCPDFHIPPGSELCILL